MQVKELIKTKLKENITPISAVASKIAFAFTGQGSHYAALGKEVLDNSSLFRETLLQYKNTRIMQGFLSFMPLIDGTCVDVGTLSPVVVQLGLLCFEMAMARLWASKGIIPSVVIGHSLGKYIALNISGVISASDAIYLVGSRAQLLIEKCAVGSHGMLAVKSSVAAVASALGDPSINIACINGPGETVLSGEVEQITAVGEKLNAPGFECTQLKLPFAFHSSQVNPILEDYRRIAACVNFHPATVPVISTHILAIWFEDGVCKEESNPRPDPYQYGHAQWLLENRSDFEPNLWDEYLPESRIRCVSMPGNHFTMMGGEMVSDVRFDVVVGMKANTVQAKRLGELMREGVAME